ncbi:hypothetical protein SAMN02787142_0683 [Burkholderia sp. WP9]|uniref:hypothetical protein n=1 Tax=Burkholderia sp. WP9 TaxID=1500263 RepID=UPI0008947ABF|nr:hypothetical protein [Burkholderia sp. WP9]SEB99084.1 hypothetical protein SAMN02787142_0683 [Burkholderia sp. WP9]
MHAKKRNGRFSLYRSQYVRKGAMGNSHGYAAQEFVGSLPAEALDIPVELFGKLSPEEREYVENKVVLPARRAVEQSRRVAEEERRAQEFRERDPRWRVDDALRLLAEVAKLASQGDTRVEAGKVKVLRDALEGLATTAKLQPDPLDAVRAAVVSATTAVKAGHYGTAPAGNVRDTNVYKRWRSIGEAVDSGKDSLLKALQEKGWARVRG